MKRHTSSQVRLVDVPRFFCFGVLHRMLLSRVLCAIGILPGTNVGHFSYASDEMTVNELRG